MSQNTFQVILGELSLYSQRQQKAIFSEFYRTYPGCFSKTKLLEFLKQYLQIEENWQRGTWLQL
jgi:hypothetical protein